jgi:hypothetical protein
MKLFYRTEKFNKDLKRTNKGKNKCSRSFVKPFVVNLYEHWAMQPYATTDINGDSRSRLDTSLYNTAPSFHVGCSGGNTPTANTNLDYSISSYIFTFEAHQCGLVIGSGTTAVIPEQYNLTTPIIHGTGTGELEFFGTEVGDLEIGVGDTAYYEVRRIFRNSSGGNVTIGELGLSSSGFGYYNQPSYFLYVRDVPTAPIVVPDGNYIQIIYTIQITA